MKKNLLFIGLIPLLLTSCQGPTEKVIFPFSDEVRTLNGQWIELDSYNDLVYKVDNADTFILVLGNSTCGCTIDLKPVIEDWSEQTRIPVHYLEYTLLLYQEEKFDIPLVSTNAPIIALFSQGELLHYRAYNTRTSSENALFYDLDLLSDWFDQYLDVPSFQFLTKTSFDSLFETTGHTLLLYIGREDCPDCSYAFNTFMTDFLITNRDLPPMYGLDVMQNGIRIPTVPGQEEVTGNNTPGWEQFKTDYGLNTTLNTTFGYATGFVPTFMIVETNGKTIAEDPSIIVDMLVVYNDTTRDEQGNWTQNVTRTFFDGSRPLQYTDLDLTTITLAEHSSSATLRDALRPYHNQAMQDFFDYYVPRLSTSNVLGL